LTTGEESYSWYGWGNSSRKRSNGVEGNLLWASSFLALGSWSNHIWFEEETFEKKSLLDKLSHNVVEDSLRNLGAGTDIMISIGDNLWLDNWDETVMLANVTISSKRMGSLLNGNLRWAVFSNLDDSSPFGESASHLIVLLASGTKSIKTLGDTLVIGSWDDGHTSIDLDSSKNTLVGQDFDKFSSIRG